MVRNEEFNETFNNKTIECKFFATFFVANFESKNSHERLIVKVTIMNFFRYFQ